MPEDAKRTLTPKLRFPEFRIGEGWEEKPLKAICEINPATCELPDSFVYIDLESVEGGVLNARKRIERTDAPSRAQRLLNNGDVVFQIVRPYQRNNLFVRFDGDDTYVASTGYAQLRANESESFLYQVVHTDPFVDRVIAKCTGSSYPAINSSDLAEVLLPVPPSVGEQQKIADCLTSLDELIAAQGRKVAALKAHKKGLMQQLFPRESETVPRLRFPEFRDGPEWEERKAGTLFGNRINKGIEGLPIYSVTMHDGMVRRDSFDRDFYDIVDATGNKNACKNDVAYNMMRMWQGALGVAPEDCLVSPAYVVLSPQKDVVSKFFEYLFKLPASLLLLTSHSRGLTKDRLRLYYDDFARIPLRCPGREEQRRIANCLSSYDDIIAVETKKHAGFKTHKKGLMQQLFPSPEGD
jgi:type I restriction enzyme S subunit